MVLNKIRNINYLLKKRLFLFLLLQLAKSPHGIPFKRRGGSGPNSISIARYYVDHFIFSHLCDIKGDVLEVGRSVYNGKIAECSTSYQCLDIENFPDVDIVSDIQNMEQVATNSFDSILCTQVLEHVKNPFFAVSELHRILKPRGKLFMTVPFYNSIHMEPHDYWRFTEFSVEHLLSDFRHVEICKYGNITNFVLSSLKIHADEINREILLQETGNDQLYVIIGVVAQKA